MHKHRFISILPLLLTPYLFGNPFTPPAESWAGQVRMRTEWDDKALPEGWEPVMRTHLRSRLGYHAQPNERVGVVFEVQDARFFGGEGMASAPPPAASISDMEGLDLLQGYGILRFGAFETALGRQKHSLGSGRLLSTLEWHPYSRSFDGASAQLQGKWGRVQGMSFLVRDESVTAAEDYQILSGIFYARPLMKSLGWEVYGFHEGSSIPQAYSGEATGGYDLAYLGQRVHGKIGPVSFEEEFIIQLGNLSTPVGDRDSRAYMAGTRAGIKSGALVVNLGLDMMSGDASPGSETSTLYRVNYWFAHAYFGWMDYFVQNPAFGVMDWRADAAVTMGSAELKMQYHYFLPANAPDHIEGAYGQEFNAEVNWAPAASVKLVWGAGVFLPGQAAHLIPSARLATGSDDKPGVFLYFMPVFDF